MRGACKEGPGPAGEVTETKNHCLPSPPPQINTAATPEERHRLALQRVPQVALPASELPEAAVTQDVRRWGAAGRFWFKACRG